MEEIPFKIHAVVDHGGWGEALNADGEFLFELDSTGVLQLQEAFPAIRMISATPAEIPSASSTVRMDSGGNYVNGGRVVGVRPDSCSGYIQEAYNWDNFEVFGVAVESGQGEVRVVTQPGTQVMVDLEMGQASQATMGTPVYLGTSDGKVTTDPINAQIVTKVGIVNQFPEYGMAIDGGDRVSILLTVGTRPTVTVS